MQTEARIAHGRPELHPPMPREPYHDEPYWEYSQYLEQWQANEHLGRISTALGEMAGAVGGLAQEVVGPMIEGLGASPMGRMLLGGMGNPTLHGRGRAIDTTQDPTQEQEGEEGPDYWPTEGEDG